MNNVSAIGEKFVFSHYLEPVSEEAMNKELESIDAWLEANEACNKEEVETPSADDQDAAADNTSSDSEACKESVEERIAKLQAQLEDVSGELKDLLNEKSNFDKYIDNKAQKGHEYIMKSHKMDTIAKSGSGNAAKEAAKKSEEYKKKAAKEKDVGVESDTVYGNDPDAADIRDAGKESRKGKSLYPGAEKDRKEARQVYKDKAANAHPEKKVATQTRDRKPGTYSR